MYVVYLIPSFSLSPSPVSFDRHLSHFGALYILSRTEPTAFASSAIAPAFSPNITTAPKCNRKPNRNFEIYTTNICFRLSIPFPFFRIVTFSSSQFPFRSIYYYSCSLNPFIPEACVYPNDTLNTKKKKTIINKCNLLIYLSRQKKNQTVFTNAFNFTMNVKLLDIYFHVFEWNDQKVIYR